MYARCVHADVPLRACIVSRGSRPFFTRAFFIRHSLGASSFLHPSDSFGFGLLPSIAPRSPSGYDTLRPHSIQSDQQPGFWDIRRRRWQTAGDSQERNARRPRSIRSRSAEEQVVNAKTGYTHTYTRARVHMRACARAHVRTHVRIHTGRLTRAKPDGRGRQAGGGGGGDGGGGKGGLRTQ